MRMRIVGDGLQLSKPATAEAVSEPGLQPELAPPVIEFPAEVVIYAGDQGVAFPGAVQTDMDGNTTVSIDIGLVPPPGTPVQIIVKGDPGEAPVVIETVTGTGEGLVSFVTDVPDGLHD